jgi:hypothetical protein
MAKPADDRVKEYRRIMEQRNGAPRSPVTAIPDPFAEYSLSDFMGELSILEAAGAAWDVQFCQASTGFMGRAGGCWIAYKGHEPKSVIHAETFMGKSTDQPAINFWSEYLMRGKYCALWYGLPFTILVRFEDGVFSKKVAPEDWIQFPPGTIGTRVGKGQAYADCVNMVTTIPMADFKPTRKK